MRNKIEKIPLLNQVYKYLLQSKFQTDGYSSFWGVYQTFQEAVQAAPKTKHVGYNHPDLAHEYQQMLLEDNWENSGRIVAEHDYPMLFWLNSIFEHYKVHSIFDFGGNVGVHFYGYKKYLKYPPDLQWKVCEVPEIAAVGRDIALQRKIDSLYFTSDFKDLDDQDIFIGSGSIQYIENSLQMLSISTRKPRHLLINRLPLYDGSKFVTLQNGGNVFYPQYVFNKNSFIQALESIEYELIDIWENSGDSCIIPFHLDKAVDRYSGLYFRLK
jgi:putative methyltransferase (TIGR04325 family)